MLLPARAQTRSGPGAGPHTILILEDLRSRLVVTQARLCLMAQVVGIVGACGVTERTTEIVVFIHNASPETPAFRGTEALVGATLRVQARSEESAVTNSLRGGRLPEGCLAKDSLILLRQRRRRFKDTHDHLPAISTHRETQRLGSFWVSLRVQPDLGVLSPIPDVSRMLLVNFLLW